MKWLSMVPSLFLYCFSKMVKVTKTPFLYYLLCFGTGAFLFLFILNSIPCRNGKSLAFRKGNVFKTCLYFPCLNLATVYRNRNFNISIESSYSQYPVKCYVPLKVTSRNWVKCGCEKCHPIHLTKGKGQLLTKGN